MLRIIDLDIDGSITGDTGVWEVAWVEYPAIEEELMFFGRQQFYVAPERVSSVACQAIKQNDERGNPAATQTGKVRGQQLCNRNEISLETIKRMKSYLERAKVYNTDNWDDNGTISWKLWGGQPGLDWVDSILKSLENKEEMAELEDACWEGYEPYGMKVKDGKLVPNCVPINTKMSQQEFVSPSPGESKEDYISRCIPYVINEGKTPDEAAGKCYGMWDGKFVIGDKVSFDWDDTLTDPDSIPLLEEERRRGSLIYIITARQNVSESIRRFASKYDIPSSRVIATGSNSEKIKTVTDLGIIRHYDNNPYVISKLGKKGIQFDYDISNLPSYENYPNSGDPKSMLIKPIIGGMYMSEDCGCMNKEEFNLLGYIDGQPIFSTSDEAELYGSEVMNCSGSHEHQDENGNVVYMACETHPQEFSFSVDEYSDEEKEVVELLQHLRRTDLEKFEAVVGSMNGATKQQVIERNHKTKTTYYQYERVLSGFPDRDFCMSIENRYFRRMEIDLLKDTNEKFGHNGQPYSKWLYKGGPQCVHGWHKYFVQGDVFSDEGMAQGTPGIPPQSLPGKGYYPGTSRYQANLSKQDIKLYDELTPIGWVADLPYYSDPVLASDASYILGCGGIYEQMEIDGKTMFQSCSTNMRKETPKQEQIFKTIKDKRMIYTPLMIPNILIPRMDDVSGERYFVKFTPDVIEKIQQKFMIEQRLRDTNLEHTDKKFSDVVMVESWIVTGDSDKAYSLGFTKDQIPVGTWMGAYKVLETDEGNEIWDKYIKPGKVKGASVEGNFILNFSREETDEYLLDEIINILKEIN
jgi:hypothetical protein